jgi:ferredoxin
MLRFTESACVQCGICEATCPEGHRAAPQIDFAAWAAPKRILKEEEPFCCTACGKAFGTSIFARAMADPQQSATNAARLPSRWDDTYQESRRFGMSFFIPRSIAASAGRARGRPGPASEPLQRTKSCFE